MQPNLTGAAASLESPASSEPPAQDKITLAPPVELPVPPPPTIEQASQPSAIQQQATSKTLTQTVLPEASQTTAANAQMVFEFTGRCWAEVRDSTGKAHIIGEMGAGDRRAVAANLGPFKIVLGNIKAARLTIGGKPFDLTSQTRGVVARFKLDPSQL
jgi:cytoskeleton protein RodZ